MKSIGSKRVEVRPDGWKVLEADGPGWVYRDTPEQFRYDGAAMEIYRIWDAMPSASRITDWRVGLALQHGQNVLDIGIGSGEFLTRFPGESWGFDINPEAVAWMRDWGFVLVDPFRDSLPGVDVITLFDTANLLTMEQHVALSERLVRGQKLIVSSLVAEEPDLNDLGRWPRFRPEQHRFAWTCDGLVNFFESKGVSYLDGGFRNESIMRGERCHVTYVFEKKL